jgi:hypothetical protein
LTIEEMTRRNFTESTTRAYVRIIEDLALYFNRPPDQLEPEHIRQYTAHLFRDGIPAPILYSAAQQINVQVPFEIAGQSTVQMKVIDQQTTLPVSETLTLGVVQRQPTAFLTPAASASLFPGYTFVTLPVDISRFNRRLREALVHDGGIERDTIELLRFRELKLGVDENQKAVICRVGPQSPSSGHLSLFMKHARKRTRPRSLPLH